MAGIDVFTIGHGERSLEEFIGLLGAHGITRVIDIRSLPGSRRCPQFNGETLAEALGAHKMTYERLEALGGLRKKSRTVPPEQNAGWHNASFKNYADYTESEDFQKGIEELVARAARERTAFFCAETVPWRCHRSIVADALLLRGLQVLHIVGKGPARPHSLTPFLRPEGLALRYPRPEPVEGSEPPAPGSTS